MILTKKVFIKITKGNIEYYKNKGYVCKLKDKIEVDSYDVKKRSHIKVDVSCDVCGIKRNLSLSKYWINFERDDYYSCRNCSSEKRKQTCLEKYGVENYSKLDIHKNQMSKWMSSNEFKEKSKKSLIEKYGVDHYSKTEEFKNHMDYLINNTNLIEKSKITRKQTCLKKYGVENYMLTEEYKEKRSKSMNEKYGATYSTQSKILKKKIQKSFQEKWGVNSPFESDIIKEISKNKILDKYGVENVFLLDDIKNKIKNTKIKMGLQSNDIPKYKKYKNKIQHLTRKNKKELLKQWDGYDYYDGEYIKENYNLNHLDENYPTVDHKISVLYGFINNITPEKISNINNLCITKRSINSSKGYKNFDDFKL